MSSSYTWKARTACSGAVHDHDATRGLQTQCGVNVFILDSRRVLTPAPKVPGSDIKTHLESRFCAILKKKRGVILEV